MPHSREQRNHDGEGRDRPWLDREDWASRRLGSENSGFLTVSFSALVLCVFAVFAAFFVLVGDMLGAPLAGFAAAGLVMLSAILMIVRRVRRSGTPWSVARF